MDYSYQVSLFSRARNLKLRINKRKRNASVSFYIVVGREVKDFELDMMWDDNVNRIINNMIIKVLKELDYYFKMGWEFSSRSAAEAQSLIKSRFNIDVVYV